MYTILEYSLDNTSLDSAYSRGCMPPRNRVQSCLLLTSCLSLQVAGGPSSTPAGQHVLDIDSYLDSSVLDSSFLTFPGLRAEVRAPKGPCWGGWVPLPLGSPEALSVLVIGLCWTNEK